MSSIYELNRRKFLGAGTRPVSCWPGNPLAARRRARNETSGPNCSRRKKTPRLYIGLSGSYECCLANKSDT